MKSPNKGIPNIHTSVIGTPLIKTQNKCLPYQHLTPKSFSKYL